MQTKDNFRSKLLKINGRDYKAYKEIGGVYEFPEYQLYIDYVQGDPFAAPSRIRVRVPMDSVGFPPDTFASKSREIAVRDYITRCFAKAVENHGHIRRGSGKSGLITIDTPGQEILERTSVVINKNFVEARFFTGLPAHGRKIAGREAEEMFFKVIPVLIKSSLYYSSLDADDLYHHIKTSEDTDFLRNSLRYFGLVAFVADGSVLPRVSGVDDRKTEGENIVPFMSPDSMRFGIELPNSGKIRGMGIKKGITLIVGGGYHGKSTLLNALERGVYNHIPGDGREFVVSLETSVKIRSEDNRRVENVDISPFINNLPFGRDTRSFSTEDASGSTSQAANIIESLETGAGLLLIDEDTSATNFMIRDHRMQELVAKEKEPITPFVDKVSTLYSDLGVSTILVIGGSGDYFGATDTVICMDNYLPLDCTAKAHAIAEKYSVERLSEGGNNFGEFRDRIPLADSISAKKGRRDVKISPRGRHTILFGVNTIDLSCVEQIVDVSQTRAIGDAIHYAVRYMDGKMTMKAVIDAVFSDIEKQGLDILNQRKSGDSAAFRPQELTAAVNRLRTLKTLQVNQEKE